MKQTIRLTLLFVVFISLALPGTAFARGLHDDKVVAGGAFTLRSGETLDGSLVVFGGAVTLEEDSRVNGDVVLLGGTVNINGNVQGSVVGIGGVVSLGGSAVVDGDLTTVAATLNREEGARIEGQIITGFRPSVDLPLPGGVYIPEVPNVGFSVPPFLNVIWFVFRTFLWAALAVLLVMFLPTQTERAANAIVRQPVLAGGIGLLTAIVAPLLLIGIAITIILIPVSLVGALVLAIAWFFGRIALGLEIGKRFEQMANQTWPPAVAAGVGTFVLTFIVDGAGELLSCVGWIFPAVVGILGLGGIFLTRFGTQSYPPYPEARPVPPAQPPASPASPSDKPEDASLAMPLEEPPSSSEPGADG
jgi:cytoskeletal protein CcmA (bactofilin family)